MKIKTKQGFAAFILVVSISALMLAFSFMASIEYGHFFDEVVTKENRMISEYAADSCIDQGFLMLTHDYFFRTDREIKIPELNCSIDSITVSHTVFANVAAHGDYRGIKIKRSTYGIISNTGISVF